MIAKMRECYIVISLVLPNMVNKEEFFSLSVIHSLQKKCECSFKTFCKQWNMPREKIGYALCFVFVHRVQKLQKDCMFVQLFHVRIIIFGDN